MCTTVSRLQSLQLAHNYPLSLNRCVGGAPDACNPRVAAVRMARMALDMLALVENFETDCQLQRKIQIRCVARMFTSRVKLLYALAMFGRHPIHGLKSGTDASPVWPHCLCVTFRIGIFTGDVTAAVMGRKLPHWCLVGDTVSVAPVAQVCRLDMLHPVYSRSIATTAFSHPNVLLYGMW